MIKKESKNKVRLRRHARIREKISGTKDCPRLSVFRSNKHIECQAIDDVKGVTLAHSSSIHLKLENGSNMDASKKVGEDLAKKLKALKIKEAVFDRGGYLYHGRVKALADAVRAGGIKF